MRHPFDGLSLPEGENMTRRGALGALAAATAGMAGLPAVARAQKLTTEAVGEEGGPPVATTLALGEEGAGRPIVRRVTTEPFGEEAGRVVSTRLPGLEDGGKPAPLTKARGEAGGGVATTLAIGEEGGKPKPSTRALGEEGAATRALREAGGAGPVVPVKPGSRKLTEKQLTKMWTDLASEDASVGVQACAVLYGAEGAVDFLQGKLKAKVVKAPEVDPKKLPKLIADLDADAHVTREAAEAALIKMGPGVAEAVETALKGAKSPEQRMRLKRILAKVSDQDGQRQSRRGVEVLVALGTPEAKKLLDTLAKGDEKAWLTEVARDARKRVK